MLTIEELKQMKPDTIFASGVADDSPKGINMTNSGAHLKWIAIRGGIHDWAIYCGGAIFSDQHIRDWGAKVHDEETIKKLVPCTDEAYAMYRH